MGREAPPGEGKLAISGSHLEDAGWSLQPKDGMQEEENSLSKFSLLFFFFFSSYRAGTIRNIGS